MILTPKFLKEVSEDEADILLYNRLWRNIIGQGQRGVGPLISEVLADPAEFGVKSALRREIISVTLNSLRRIGYYGGKQDIQMQSALARVIRSKIQDGGDF